MLSNLEESPLSSSLLFVFSSLLAGACISIGATLQLITSEISPLLGAVAFSSGLVLVRIFKLKLYTGKCGTLLDYDFRDVKYVAAFLALMFFLKCVGTVFLAELVQGLPARPSPISQGWACLAPAMLCGGLVHLATREDVGIFGTILCVVAFIIGGGLHCIAEAFHWIRNGLPDGGAVWLMKIAIGNAAGATLVYLELGE